MRCFVHAVPVALLLVLSLGLAWPVRSDQKPDSTPDGFTSLFNGRNLEGRFLKGIMGIGRWWMG